MSRQRRNFSAKFKSDLVIELLKGEKDLNTLATENNIQPNLLRNWKKEFLNNASAVFEDRPSVPFLFRSFCLILSGHLCPHSKALYSFFSPFWIVFYQVHGPDALFRLATFSFPENPDHAGALLFVFYRCSI